MLSLDWPHHAATIGKLSRVSRQRESPRGYSLTYLIR